MGVKPTSSGKHKRCFKYLKFILIAAGILLVGIEAGLGFALVVFESNPVDTRKLVSTPLPNSISSGSSLPLENHQQSKEEHYNFTAAICVCIKDAEAYFEEWVDYHLAMDFQTIYIYDDSPTFDLQRWYQNSRNHPIYSEHVEIIHYNRTLEEEKYKRTLEDEEKNDSMEEDDDEASSSSGDDPINFQNTIYRDCVGRFGLDGPKHDYFAFIDVDEYLVLQTNKYTGIRGVLHDYLVPFGGALTVNWMLIGSSNKTVYSPLPVTKRFQYRDEKAHGVIKSIVKASHYIQHRNPHAVSVHTKDGSNNIHTTKYPGALHKEAEGPTGASDGDFPSDILLLYHFRYTSMKEYIFKRCIRGQIDRGSRWCSKEGGGIRNENVPAHILSSPGSVFDDKAWQFLKFRVPKYRLFDEFEDLS